MCKAESAGRDILTAGGQIQLLCFSLVATAPTSGGPRPPQRSCPNPVHLQRVVVLGVVWCGVGWGDGRRRRSILQGVALQSYVMYCRGMCRSVGLLHLCGTAAFVKCAQWVKLSLSSQSVVNLQKKKTSIQKTPNVFISVLRSRLLFSGTLVCSCLHHKGALTTLLRINCDYSAPIWCRIIDWCRIIA